MSYKTLFASTVLWMTSIQLRLLCFFIPRKMTACWPAITSPYSSKRVLVLQVQCVGAACKSNQIIQVTVKDRCIACESDRHRDLSKGAFNKIANLDTGVISIQYCLVPCWIYHRLVVSRSLKYGLQSWETLVLSVCITRMEYYSQMLVKITCKIQVTMHLAKYVDKISSKLPTRLVGPTR